MINIHDCSLCEHKMVCTYKNDFLALRKKPADADRGRIVLGDKDNLLEGDLRCKYHSKDTPNIKGV